jgi:hypothetical protein
LFFDVGGIIDHHCLNFLLFFDVVRIVDHHYLSFLLFFDVGDGQQFHQHQQNKRKFKK